MVVHACNPSYFGGWGLKISWAWEAEATVSQDHTIARQAEWQSKTLSEKEKKKTKQKEMVLGKLDIHLQKNETGPLHHTWKLTQNGLKT